MTTKAITPDKHWIDDEQADAYLSLMDSMSPADQRQAIAQMIRHVRHCEELDDFNTRVWRNFCWYAPVVVAAYAFGIWIGATYW